MTPRQSADSLLTLSNSLQHRLLAHVARSTWTLQRLLSFLPSHIHHALVAATITAAKELNVPLHQHAVRIIKALPGIPPHPPSILSLRVHIPEDDGPLPGHIWQAAAPHLAQALQHHSSITSLRLDTDYHDAASALLLAPAIATLTSLQSLHLHSVMNSATFTALQQTLQALPALQDLALSLMVATKHHDSLKRQHHGNTADPFQCCLATLLSPATHLTSLKIRTNADTGKHCYTTTQALALPRLRQLDVSFGRHTQVTDATTSSHTIAASSLLSHLAAPLTSLGLQPNDQHYPLDAGEPPHAQRLFSSLARFTQLRRLSFSAWQGHGTNSAAAAAMHAVMAAAAAALAALRHLESLTIAADAPTLLASLPPLAGATGLSHLCLIHRQWLFHPRAPLTPAPWGQIFAALSAFRLVSLELEDAPQFGALQAHGWHPPVPAGLAHLRLRELTRLSALRVCGWECLSTEEDIAALSSMTTLRKLHLIDVVVPPEMHFRCAYAVAALSALTEFAHQAQQEPGAFAGALTGLALPGVWPELRQLSLDVSIECGPPDGFFQFASARPALTQLALNMVYGVSYELEHGSVEEVVDALAAEVDYDVAYVAYFPF